MEQIHFRKLALDLYNDLNHRSLVAFAGAVVVHVRGNYAKTKCGKLQFL